jgi:hypothetical protein
MRKHKGKLIAAAAVVCLLAVAWVIGGDRGDRAGEAEAVVSAADSARTVISAPDPAPEGGTAAETEAPPAAPVVSEDEAPERVMVIDPETGKDRYQTDPVPPGRPLPVEPGDVPLSDGELSCAITVRCDVILDNMGLLDKEKWELVPEDGVVLPATDVVFYEGESVFNVLSREMKRAGIHMEFMNTPIYNSAYIEGINNIYEFDAGELSGWMYSVNGWYPNYGCSRYLLEDGDVIEWRYTCDLGRDLGADWFLGRQRDE